TDWLTQAGRFGYQPQHESAPAARATRAGCPVTSLRAGVGSPLAGRSACGPREESESLSAAARASGGGVPARREKRVWPARGGGRGESESGSAAGRASGGGVPARREKRLRPARGERVFERRSASERGWGPRSQGEAPVARARRASL